MGKFDKNITVDLVVIFLIFNNAGEVAKIV